MSTPFQILPDLTGDEYQSLHDSIRERGVEQAVIKDQHGRTIDGHHRAKIADDLGIDYPVKVRHVESDEEARTLALTLNLDRRHLTREQKRAVVETSLRADPQLSNREHARRTGTDHKTVGTARTELESTGEIPQSETRLSGDGRQRPATQPERPRSVEHEVAVAVDEFPDLAYYADQGRDDDVLRLARALRGYDEPERTQRIETLRKSIALDAQQAESPSPEPAPDHCALVDEMFDACNKAARVITSGGGVDTLDAALAGGVDSLAVTNWQDQFARLAGMCESLARACKPSLRRVK